MKFKKKNTILCKFLMAHIFQAVPLTFEEGDLDTHSAGTVSLSAQGNYLEGENHSASTARH